ncbi:hypothetical protein BC831DRAFT_448079, partial [Entophlyctis helioformis]
AWQGDHRSSPDGQRCQRSTHGRDAGQVCAAATAADGSACCVELGVDDNVGALVQHAVAARERQLQRCVGTVDGAERVRADGGNDPVGQELCGKVLLHKRVFEGDVEGHVGVAVEGFDGQHAALCDAGHGGVGAAAGRVELEQVVVQPGRRRHQLE